MTNLRIPLINEHSISIPVKIESAVTYKNVRTTMILDTKRTMSLISSECANDLGYTLGNYQKKIETTIYEDHLNEIIKLSKLHILDSIIENIEMQIHPIDKRYNIGGFLGLDILSRTNIQDIIENLKIKS